jgi:hypothetical protein
MLRAALQGMVSGRLLASRWWGKRSLVDSFAFAKVTLSALAWSTGHFPRALPGLHRARRPGNPSHTTRSQRPLLHRAEAGCWTATTSRAVSYLKTQRSSADQAEA